VSSRHQREKRAARRAGTTSGTLCPHPRPLVPHTARCPCAACDKKRADQLARAQRERAQRDRAYRAGHAVAEFRTDFLLSIQPLADYMQQYLEHRSRRKVTSLEMRPQWLNYLDDVVAAESAPLDWGCLADAWTMYEVMHPLRWRIMAGCVMQQRTQEDVAQQECMSQQAVGQNLAAARDDLLDIYGGLLLLEQRKRAAC
jgi:hypothetical protein